MNSKVFHFFVAFGASCFFIALIPSNVAVNYEGNGVLFEVSCAFVAYYIVYGVKVSQSLVSAQAIIGVIWFFRFFLPNMFVENTYHPVLQMVGMTDVGQFQVATILTNAATLMALSSASLFGKLVKLDLRHTRASWSKVSQVSMISFVVGLTSILLFLVINVGSLSEAVIEGSMRSMDVVRGSGYLWYVGLAVIPSSLLYAYSQYQRIGCFTPSMLIPVVIAFFVLSLLGGRVRALIPVAAIGFLFMRVTGLDKPSLKSFFMMASGLFGVLIYMAIAMTYRAGGINTVIELGVDEVITYAAWTIPGEIGQLHGPYLAIAYGEGNLIGQTYQALLWPLSEILNLGPRNTGVIVRDLGIGEDVYERNWGFHPSLIGDALLNFGRWFIPVKFIILGCVMGWFQSKKRLSAIAIPTSILVTLGLARSFSESTDKISELYVYLAVLYFIYAFGNRLRIPSNIRLKSISAKVD